MRYSQSLKLSHPNNNNNKYTYNFFHPQVAFASHGGWKLQISVAFDFAEPDIFGHDSFLTTTHTSNERIGKGIGNSSDSRTSPPKKACLYTGVGKIKNKTIRNEGM